MYATSNLRYILKLVLTLFVFCNYWQQLKTFQNSNSDVNQNIYNLRGFTVSVTMKDLDNLINSLCTANASVKIVICYNRCVAKW